MRCRFTWVNLSGERVQCQHDSSVHPASHEWWGSRGERRRWSGGASWVVVGAEHAREGAWLDDASELVPVLA